MKNLFYNFEKFRYDVERVLSSDEILITKKNKKRFRKTTDFKKSIGSYRFEDNSLFIHLKKPVKVQKHRTLRADSLMELVDSERIYNITRLRFLDEKLREL